MQNEFRNKVLGKLELSKLTFETFRTYLLEARKKIIIKKGSIRLTLPKIVLLRDVKNAYFDRTNSLLIYKFLTSLSFA